MIFAYSDYLKKECKERGFDWDAGSWRNKFLWEMTISKNPECSICSNYGECNHFSIAISDKEKTYNSTHNYETPILNLNR
jgi:hypothetical protein